MGTGRKWLLPIVAALAAGFALSPPALSADGPRLGDPSSAFDAAMGPATLGQTWWFYPLPDGSLARGAAPESSLEVVPQVLFLQRSWSPGRCADTAAVDATRQQYFPEDAQRQWSSSIPGGGSPAGTQVEGWYSNSLATMLSGSGLKNPGSIVVTNDYGFGENCAGTVRLTFDGSGAE